jgi:hypothetical protein
MPPIETLKSLTDTKTLAKILGSKDIAKAILSGDLRPSESQIQTIAKALAIDPACLRYPKGRPKHSIKGRSIWVPGWAIEAVEDLIRKGDRN